MSKITNKINLDNMEDDYLANVMGPSYGLEEAFNVFYKDRENQNLKERTLKDHKTHFRYFSTFLYKRKTEIKRVGQMTYKIISDYISFMKNEKVVWDDHKDLCKTSNKKGLAPATINCRLRSLRALFKFWFDNGFVEEDISSKIKLLKDETTFNKLGREEVNRLLVQPEKKKKYTDLRDFVLMLLLIDIGPRISHILSVKMEDIDLATQEICLPAGTSKKREEQVQFFSEKTAWWINHLMKLNVARGFPDSFLFLTISGGQYQDDTFRKRLKKYAKQAGISKKVRVSPHSFRHYVATNAHENGASVFEMQLMLGHSSIEATKRYVSTDKKQLKKIRRKYSAVDGLI